jgi:uncharacterized membrane protein YeiH
MFTCAGIEVSLIHNINDTYAIVMGMITGTFGGLIADIISNTVPDLLKRGELYATASLIGGVVYILIINFDFSHNIALIICLVIVVALRIISKIKRLMLPEI